MTLTNTIASKLFVGFVAIAMALSLVAPAQAATEAEMEAQIAALMAQINALTAQLGQGTTGGSMINSSTVCPYAWTRSLTTGSTGADVLALQKFLNADAATQVAASGVGSVGMETDYFGGLTAAAVSNFQVKYRDEILTPAGLVNPTGYFGPSTMAKANALCASAPVMDDSSDDDMSDDDDSADFNLSGEASLKSFDIEDGDDTDLEEGQTEESVLEFVVEFEDGDAMITRLDVHFNTDATDDIWDVIGEVTLYVDGDEVAQLDGSDEDEWRDGTSSSDDTEAVLRFTGLEIIGEEDEELTVVLGVEVQDNLDDTSQVVAVDVDGMRFVDGDDVTSTLDASEVDADANSFNIEAAGSEDEFIFKSNPDDPQATTLIVDEGTLKSDWYTVFVFDMDTDDSTNDIDLNTIAFEVTAGTADVNDVVQDAELVIDGTTYDDWEWSGADDTMMAMLFDVDGDHTIDAGDRVEAELRLRFYGNDGEAVYAEGETIEASASTTLTDVEGVEDVTATGAADSEQHVLRSSGLVADATSVETSETTSGTDDTTGTFEISFEVTALEGDFYVQEDNFNYTIEGATSTVSDDAVLSSTGDEETTGVFTVREGETETFTLTVTFTTDTAGLYRVTMDDMDFSSNPNGTTNAQTLELLPATDYRTDYENVNAT